MEYATFLSMDEQLPTGEVMTDEEIVQEVQGITEEEEDKDDEVEEKAGPPPISQAEFQDISSKFLQCLQENGASCPKAKQAYEIISFVKNWRCSKYVNSLKQPSIHKYFK